jgi:hypothetical protein
VAARPRKESPSRNLLSRRPNRNLPRRRPNRPTPATPPAVCRHSHRCGRRSRRATEPRSEPPNSNGVARGPNGRGAVQRPPARDRRTARGDPRVHARRQLLTRSFTLAERRARLPRRHFPRPDRPADSITGTAANLVGLHTTDPATRTCRCGHGCPAAPSPIWTPSFISGAPWSSTSRCAARCGWCAPGPAADSVRRQRPCGRQRTPAAGRRPAEGGHRGRRSRLAGPGGAAVLRHLWKHGPASAKELRTALPELAGSYDYAPGKRWGGKTPLAPRVLTVLSVRGDIVRGPNDGGWTVSRPLWTTAAD